MHFSFKSCSRLWLVHLIACKMANLDPGGFFVHPFALICPFWRDGLTQCVKRKAPSSPACLSASSFSAPPFDSNFKGKLKTSSFSLPSFSLPLQNWSSWSWFLVPSAFHPQSWLQAPFHTKWRSVRLSGDATLKSLMVKLFSHWDF